MAWSSLHPLPGGPGLQACPPTARNNLSGYGGSWHGAATQCKPWQMLFFTLKQKNPFPK